MQLSQTRIATRLAFGFAVVILLTGIMAAMAVRTMSTLAELASDLYVHPFAVTNALMQVRVQVNAMRADMLSLVRADNQTEVDRLAAQVARADSEVEVALDVIRRQYLGNPADVALLTESLRRWKITRETNMTLARAGRFAEAVDNARQNGAPQHAALRDDLERIYNFARNKAAEFASRIETERQAALRAILLTLLGLVALGVLLARLITRSIVAPLRELRLCMGRLADGDLTAETPRHEGKTEMAEMARALGVLKAASIGLDRQRWVKDGLARLSGALQPAETLPDFGRAALEIIAPLMGAGAALIHARREESDLFEQAAAWGASGVARTFRAGEGLAGECAKSRVILVRDDLPPDYLPIASSLGRGASQAALIAPAVMAGRVLAVIELGSFTPFTPIQRAFLDEALPILALNLEILERNIAARKLLIQTQAQSEELQASEEQLRAQGASLQAANEELLAQQDALQAANEELSAKGDLLEAARAEADRRAVELDQASRYKSEFLANMSHELRTPLNSLLILSKSLAENEEGNLTEDQVESATVVHESGANLLALINEILDLSKIEAGKMTVQWSETPLDGMIASLLRRFLPLAQDKGLGLDIAADPALPPILRLDRGKIDQIANNLVGNALKFTAKGAVTVRFSHPDPGQFPGGGDPRRWLRLTVQDTGVGIAESDSDRVFRAFEQVDGGTARQHGGTGLGLTISRQLARLMGGEVQMESRLGQGSLFTLVLPLTAPCAPEAPAEDDRATQPAARPRARIDGAPPTLLVVEDDPVFRAILCDLAVKRGFAVIGAANGLEGVETARARRPDGVILDIGLPGLDGWGVIAALKANAETAAIPVHVISAADERLRAGEAGAIGFLAKPAEREQIEAAFDSLVKAQGPHRRKVLLAMADSAEADSVIAILKKLDLDILASASGAAALALLPDHQFDCVIAAPRLADMTGAEFLERAAKTGPNPPPAIIYSATELPPDETLRLREFTDSIVIRAGLSSDRLVDEVTLFLRSVQSRLGQDAPPPIRSAALDGKTALVVDDDMRSAFALSKILRAKGLKTLIAQDAAKALAHLASQERVDLVLMDIMMPGMDGWQAMREIRKQAKHRALPIIALTAKAMAGDREKCLEAGANDYMAKPVNLDALLPMMARLLEERLHAGTG